MNDPLIDDVNLRSGERYTEVSRDAWIWRGAAVSASSPQSRVDAAQSWRGWPVPGKEEPDSRWPRFPDDHKPLEYIFTTVGSDFSYSYSTSSKGKKEPFSLHAKVISLVCTGLNSEIKKKKKSNKIKGREEREKKKKKK